MVCGDASGDVGLECWDGDRRLHVFKLWVLGSSRLSEFLRFLSVHFCWYTVYLHICTYIHTYIFVSMYIHMSIHPYMYIHVYFMTASLAALLQDEFDPSELFEAAGQLQLKFLAEKYAGGSLLSVSLSWVFISTLTSSFLWRLACM